MCFVRIFQNVPQLPRPHSILIGIGEVLTEMGRELPLVVVDNRFGILAENPRLRINNTSLLHQSFFSSFMICFFLLMVMGKLHTYSLDWHGAELYMKLYEANYYYIALAMRVQYYYVSARGVGA